MRTSILMVAIATLAVIPASAQERRGAASRAPSRVYVADFVSRSITDTTVLASFTDLFETALVNGGGYRVLNRRNLHRMLAEAKSESYVSSMRDLPSQVRARLPAIEGAEGVVFGEVADDIESGEISVSITLESFDSTIHWKRSRSMLRGLVRDLSSRRTVMEQLANLTASPLGGGQGRAEQRPPEPRPDPGMVTVVFRPRSRSEGLQRLRFAVNDTVVGDIVFAPNPQALEVTGPPGWWRIDYILVGLGVETRHSYRAQFGKDFLVERSGIFLVDAYDDRRGSYGINLVADVSPFR